MTALIEKPMTEVTRMPVRRSHATEWVLGVVGAVVAGIGAWMYYVPTDWFLGGLVEGWPFAMFIGAGILLAAAFGLFAWKAYQDDRGGTTAVVLGSLMALVALAGAITFAVIWII